MSDTERNTEGEATPSTSARVVKQVSKLRTPLIAAIGSILSAAFAFVLWALVEGNGPSFGSYNYEAQIWYDRGVAAAAILLGISGVLASLLWAAGRSFTTETEKTLRQLEDPSLRDLHVHGAGATIHISSTGSQSGAEQPGTARLLESDAQESMLTRIYTHGLAQAKLSFFVSLAFAVIGSTVLLFGVWLAILHADTNGNRYGAIVTQTSGAVIDILAGVFFLQSNRTRRDMGSQGVMLRDDSRFDRRLKAATVLSDNISEERLRNTVRAQIALQLVGGQLDTTQSADQEQPTAEASAADGATSTTGEETLT
ncbi:hypothetical protein ABT186_04905 [Streptomyces sp. NPDC001634]